MKHYIAHNAEEMQKIAYDFAVDLNPYLSKKSLDATKNIHVIGLYGDLGAGKTTFTQGFAKGLGVVDKIVSPTFVIEKIYEVGLQARPFFRFIHIDAYRLEISDELLHLGWKEIISNSANIILIEWPERVADIMPPHIQIHFKTLENENEREIQIN